VTDDKALLKAIADSPDEDTPRLVYADWLDENGQPDRAEFIRVQCQFAQLTKGDPYRSELHERQSQLLAIHRRDWLPEHWSFAPYPPEKWLRGFVSGVEKQGGHVTREDGASLAAIPTIESLAFSATGLGDEEFRYLPVLPNLTEFALWGSEELTSVSFSLMSRWQTLRDLQLLSSGLDDDCLEHLAALQGLVSLDVFDGAQAEVLSDAGLSYIKGLTNLQAFSLHAPRVTGLGLEVLSGLPLLRKLSIGGCRLTEDAIAPLVGCSHLEELDLNHYENGGIGDQLLAALPRLPLLRILSVLRGDVTASGFRSLSRLSGLEELAVGGQAFGDDELESLRNLPQLRRLQLHSCLVTQVGLRALELFPSLRALTLRCPQLEDVALTSIARITELRSLDLGGCDLNDDRLVHLSEFPNLETLSFRSLWVTDAGIAKLKRLPKLRHLNIDHTRATKEFVWDRRAECAPQLESLRLNGQAYGPIE